MNNDKNSQYPKLRCPVCDLQEIAPTPKITYSCPGCGKAFIRQDEKFVIMEAYLDPNNKFQFDLTDNLSPAFHELLSKEKDVNSQDDIFRRQGIIVDHLESYQKWAEQGTYCLKNQLFEESVYCFMNALHDFDSNPGFWLKIALVTSNFGLFGIAGRAVEVAEKIDPNYGLLARISSQIEKEREDWTRDTASLSEKVKLGRGLYKIAEDSLRTGNLPRAEIRLRQSLEKDPNNLLALNNLGTVLMQLNKVDEGEEFLKNVLVMDPDNADACYNLMNIHLVRKNLPEAIEWAKEAVRLEPNNTRFRKKLREMEEWLKQDQANNRKGRKEKRLKRKGKGKRTIKGQLGFFGDPDARCPNCGWQNRKGKGNVSQCQQCLTGMMQGAGGWLPVNTYLDPVGVLIPHIQTYDSVGYHNLKNSLKPKQGVEHQTDLYKQFAVKMYQEEKYMIGLRASIEGLNIDPSDKILWNFVGDWACAAHLFSICVLASDHVLKSDPKNDTALHIMNNVILAEKNRPIFHSALVDFMLNRKYVLGYSVAKGMQLSGDTAPELDYFLGFHLFYLHRLEEAEHHMCTFYRNPAPLYNQGVPSLHDTCLAVAFEKIVLCNIGLKDFDKAEEYLEKLSVHPSGDVGNLGEMIARAKKNPDSIAIDDIVSPPM